MQKGFVMTSQRRALVLACACGLASSGALGGEEPFASTRGLINGDIREVAHIYFNLSSGDKVVTLLGDGQRPVDTGSSVPVWSQQADQMCLADGYSSTFFFSPDNLSMVDSMGNPMSSLALESFFTDWGDLPTDVVVDCVQVNWVTTFQDTDSNSDSVGDGIEGLAADWLYMWSHNGRPPADSCLSIGLVGFRFFNLPGLPPSFTGSFGKYTMDVDLTASGTFGTDLTFELGDTDSDFQGAAFGVYANGESSLPGYYTDVDSDGIDDGDQDQDGLADWGWGVTFIQPGRQDVDNADGDSDSQTGIDGDFASASTIGIALAALDGGTAVDLGNGAWAWEPGVAYLATEDAYTQYTGFDFMGIPAGINTGPTNFGGMDCSPGQSEYVPGAYFQVVLYGPGKDPCFGADLTGDFTIDFFDISFLLQNEVDWNGDTTFDFFDISGYLQAISGCSG